jgi:hypothetical protein
MVILDTVIRIESIRIKGRILIMSVIVVVVIVVVTVVVLVVVAGMDLVDLE